MKILDKYQILYLKTYLKSQKVNYIFKKIAYLHYKFN